MKYSSDNNLEDIEKDIDILEDKILIDHIESPKKENLNKKIKLVYMK